MKIKVKKAPLEEVLKLKIPEHKPPKKPNIFFRTLLKVASMADLKATDFSYKLINMEELPKEPCLILMNHSSFIDLEIAATIFYKKPFNIVTTSDGFVGKFWLMRQLGCIPTQKFVSDLTLLSDIKYAIKNGTSVLLYPEASYSFDGTATTMPKRSSAMFKYLRCPVLMVKTEGAFSRDPLYNFLQKRKVKVSATVELLLNKDDIKAKSIDEMDEIVKNAFSFDNFKWQQENRIKIDERFRADGLDKILYKCPHCGKEGRMFGKGTEIVCEECKKSYTLDEYGYLKANDAKFTHIPDWYAWERSCVRQEITDGTYKLDIPVDIRILADFKAIYEVGTGRLIHDKNGFKLTSDDGKLDFCTSPEHSHSLYADYFWYELGDIICIGNNERLYYCFPKVKTPVAKARLATEELYKLIKG